jgi:hypothetical protein
VTKVAKNFVGQQPSTTQTNEKDRKDSMKREVSKESFALVTYAVKRTSDFSR